MKRRFGETFGEAMNGVTLTTTIPVTGTAGERISTTIKAIAVKSGMQNSSVTSATYVIGLPAPAPSTYAVTVNNGTCDGALDKLTGIYVDDNIAPQALSFPISYTNDTNNEQYFWNNHYQGSRS